MKIINDLRADRVVDVFENCMTGQVNIVTLKKDIITAWHSHPWYDFFYCLDGEIVINYIDSNGLVIYNKINSNSKVVTISPNSWHGYKPLSDYTRIIYLMNTKYNPNEIQMQDITTYQGIWE